MNEIAKELFVNSLKAGDIGLCLGNSIFSKLQNILRKKRDRVDERASHGFYVRNNGGIIEANGIKVARANIERYFTNHHKIWIFRYNNVNEEQIKDMNLMADVLADAETNYSWGGIKEFFKWLLNKKYKMKNEKGMFCTELTGYLIKGVNLPYITDKEYYQIDPSYQLSWFDDVATKQGICIQTLYFENGKFYSF